MDLNIAFFDLCSSHSSNVLMTSAAVKVWRRLVCACLTDLAFLTFSASLWHHQKNHTYCPPPPKVKEVMSSPLLCLLLRWDFEHPQFSSDWLEIWRGFIFQVTEFNQPIIFEVNMEQKVNRGQRSTTKVIFLKSSIFIQLTWNLKKIDISGHWIQLPIYFWCQHRPKINNSGEISKIANFHPID